MAIAQLLLQAVLLGDGATPFDADIARLAPLPSILRDVSTVDGSGGYRIDAAREPRLDAKRAALNQTWRRCGVHGMPVCPTDGREVFRSGF